MRVRSVPLPRRCWPNSSWWTWWPRRPPVSTARRRPPSAPKNEPSAITGPEGEQRGISVVRRDAQAMLGSARTREAQDWRLLEAGAIGVVTGLILFPLLGFPIARAVPFGSLADRLAAS